MLLVVKGVSLLFDSNMFQSLFCSDINTPFAHLLHKSQLPLVKSNYE